LLGVCNVKTASVLMTLAVAFTSTTAIAQNTTSCPMLPSGSQLQWEQQVQSDFIVCKAQDANGRDVLNLMLMQRDPDLLLSRSLRAEKGVLGGASFHWYKMDTGGQNLPGQDLRRISVVKLDKNRYAQVWINAADAAELSAMQQLAGNLGMNQLGLANAVPNN
jgi:hypothetical protein